MQKIKITSFCLFLFATTYAQNIGVKISINEAYALDIAKKIWISMGYQYDGFRVEFAPADHQIATYYKRDNVIKIRETAIREMEKLGFYADDAVAVILAHELWHKKQGEEGVGYGSSDRKEERDADYYGLMGAHFAGYASMEIYDNLLGKLNLTNVQERKKNNDSIAEKLEKILPLYDIACYYTLIGETTSLGAAKAKFEKLEKRINEFDQDNHNHFIVRPLKYQQGLVDLILALKAADIMYVFPVELIDNNFLNPKRGKTSQEPNITAALKYLTDAESHFNKVPITDDYFEINMGRAIIDVIKEILGKQTQDATDKQLQSLLQKTKNNKHKQQHDLLKAIVKYHRNKDVELLNFLEKSDNIDIKGYASANLRIINDASVNLNQVNYFSQLDDLDGITSSNFTTVKVGNLKRDAVNRYVSYFIHEYNNSSDPKVAWNDIALSGGGITMGAGQFRYFKTDSDKYHIIFVVSGETDNTAVVTKIIRIFKN